MSKGPEASNWADPERLGRKILSSGLPDSGLMFTSGFFVAGFLGVHGRTLRCYGGRKGPRHPRDSASLIPTQTGKDRRVRGEREEMEGTEGVLGTVPGAPALPASSDQEVGNATYK